MKVQKHYAKLCVGNCVEGIKLAFGKFDVGHVNLQKSLLSLGLDVLL